MTKEYDVYKNCGFCGGTGKEYYVDIKTHEGKWRACSDCDGTGKIFWGEIRKPVN